MTYLTWQSHIYSNVQIKTKLYEGIKVDLNLDLNGGLRLHPILGEIT